MIDIQVRKAQDALTLDLGVVETAVYWQCWGSDPPPFVEEPDCTVRARIGQLIEEKDVWWSFSNREAVDEVVEAVAKYALPFLARMHSRNAMADFLTEQEVVKVNYPLPIIYLAILRSELGDTTSGCAILHDLRQKTVEAWRSRVEEVAERIGC